MQWISGRPDGHQRRTLTAPDGVPIMAREWPRPDARAAILYLHGQGDHSGPFTHMGDWLHERGHQVLAYDHRGFGLSPARRGDIDTFDRYVADAVHVLKGMAEAEPGRPRFLLGLSMGGHIALRTAAQAEQMQADGRPLLSGVIALSPGFRLRQSPSWKTVFRTLWLYLTEPDRYVPPLGGYSIITTKNATHLERASQDPTWTTAYTPRFYLETVRSIKRAKRELTRLGLPVLVLQGAEDYMVDPEENRRIFDRMTAPDRSFRLLEGLYHNLVAEPEMPEVAGQVADWIAERIPQ